MTMFGFGKKETVIKVAAPFAGEICDITAVPDEVFSEKMLGDGFAVIPSDGVSELSAPCDGKVTMVADTAHSVVITAGGAELLLHIGLDTVELAGEGFTALVKEGETVKQGTPLIKFDQAAITGAGKNPITMITISNMDDVKLQKKNLQNAEAVLEIEGN